MENACMKTLPNTKLPQRRWRTPWLLPCSINSSTGSPTGLGIGAAPLCVAATVRSHAPGSTWPARHSAPTWSQWIPQHHQQRLPTCPYCHICAGYPRKIQGRARQANYRCPQQPTADYRHSQQPIADRAAPPPQLSPGELASLRALIHRADSSIKLSGCHTTQTQTSEVRWAARFSGHWVVTSMFA